MKKKIYLFLIIFVCIFTIILIYKSKDSKLNDKIVKEERLSIMIKEEGKSEYTKSSSKEILKGDYTLNKEKSFCDNNGEITSYDNVNGKVSFSFIGSDRCTLYFDYKTVTLIKFTLEDMEYSAESGMSVAEWIDSSYNTDGYYFNKSCKKNTSYLIENKDVIISENDTIYMEYCHNYGATLSKPLCKLGSTEIYINGSKIDPTTDNFIALDFSPATPNRISYSFLDIDEFKKIYDFYKGNPDAINDVDLSEYRGYLPLVILNSNFEKSTNFNSEVDLILEFNVTDVSSKSFSMLYYSGIRNTWEILKPSYFDYDNKLMKIKFHDFTIGSPFMLIYKNKN